MLGRVVIMKKVESQSQILTGYNPDLNYNLATDDEHMLTDPNCCRMGAGLEVRL